MGSSPTNQIGQADSGDFWIGSTLSNQIKPNEF